MSMELNKGDKTFIVGYTGGRFLNEEDKRNSDNFTVLEQLTRKGVSLQPTVGYAGWYAGKKGGKVGTVDIHKHPIAQRVDPLDEISTAYNHAIKANSIIPDEETKQILLSQVMARRSSSESRLLLPDINHTKTSPGRVSPLLDTHNQYNSSPNKKNLFLNEDIHHKMMLNHQSSNARPSMDEASIKSLLPTVGYSGWYRGKADGKLGSVDVHRVSLAEWEKDKILYNYGDQLDSEDFIFTTSRTSDITTISAQSSRPGSGMGSRPSSSHNSPTNTVLKNTNNRPLSSINSMDSKGRNKVFSP
eukprot:gene10070-13531_t